MPLLTNDNRLALLAQSIRRALDRYQFHLVAYVFMPEHVHLLVVPPEPETALPDFLKAIKRPFSFRVKQSLLAEKSPLLDKLTIRERPGRICFRFWQEGPGYDRNLSSAAAVLGAIDYIHHNPVRRGLCLRAIDWKWSSARQFIIPGAPIPFDGLTIDHLSHEIS